ncbi:metallopeptidase TldD-related protein [uncultured Parvibaculum sp.]|uniref:TldD/PmbA family protein n=1 Tax=uncultured Parvibaculum sp. TaxID=291828 RepID=UPI0030DBEBDE|tara:strand:- start:53037 stop:54413 length:1377 start_codon:yes stop_codon:yes gene_type:complete
MTGTAKADGMLSALDAAAALVDRALAAGADAADAVAMEGTSLGVSWRLGKLEDVERSEGRDIGLRVFIGRRQASVSTTDLSETSLAPMIERVVAMARAAPEDVWCGLADAALLARDWPDLDIEDKSPPPTAEQLAALASEAEEAALAVDGVTNSSGAGAGWGRSSVALVARDAAGRGFAGTYAGTFCSISCSVLAGEGTAMERDYDHMTARHGHDLESATAIGRRAGEKAVRRLHPRKVSSQAVPVVYDPRVSGGLVGHFASAISGTSIARGTSFLKNEMDRAVFARGISIVDDPHMKRGLRSKPFDGEGVANRRMNLIDDGRLTTWLLDSATARQLGLVSTGHAARGTGGSPSPAPTNLYMEKGCLGVKELIADIGQGLYITELIGMGINGVTGDYSRGASGFWIENGEITYPVSEITVAGNLKDMFLNMTPADDLEFRHGTNAPTVRVEGMTVAGT